MVGAHGGRLVERYIDAAELDGKKLEKQITLSERLRFDSLMIAIGGFSPLTGFITEKDYQGILKEMRLASGTLFAIPIVLPVDADTHKGLSAGDTVALVDASGTRVGIVEVTGTFMRDLEAEARAVYGTDDKAHPGVAKIFEEGPCAVAGDVRIALERIDTSFPDNFLTPARTRDYFKTRGWETIAAFQTRNPIHRAHEYLTKVALEMTDGLMIHPIVGEVKADDIPARTRMDCYRILIDTYYNRERVLLNILPMAMRYAGPREAIHHAIIRQNYGISHLIIGRDHAGVGSYYGTYDAQKIFDGLKPADLQIQPLKFEHAFFCRACGQMVTGKTCPHDKTQHVFLSGTKVREKLRNGEQLPEEFTRREVSELLSQWVNAKEN
jgi:sulfate adenylyltransferase